MKNSDRVYECTLDESTASVLRLYLYKDIENVEHIRNNILNKTWECVAIKPSLILDPLQVAVAANKAVVSQKNGSMVTRSVYTETLFNLSLTKNISQSLTTFGVEEENKIFVAFIDTQATEHRHILDKICGTACSVSDFGQYSNLSDIKKAYKIDDIDTKSKEDILDMIITRMSVKGFVSH